MSLHLRGHITDTLYSHTPNPKQGRCFFVQRVVQVLAKAVVIYFLSYGCVGAILFCNFLPWT